jgi:hypothetical protein
VAFTNVGNNDNSSEQDTTLTTDGKPKKDLSYITCFNCNEQGHYADDYKKLARCMKYLGQSAALPLILEAEVSNNIKWWVDSAFAVHNDMKSHTGALVSLGKGAAYATCT